MLCLVWEYMMYDVMMCDLSASLEREAGFVGELPLRSNLHLSDESVAC